MICLALALINESTSPKPPSNPTLFLKLYSREREMAEMMSEEMQKWK